MKTHTRDQLQKAYLLACTDASGYQHEELVGIQARIDFLRATLMSEMGWRITEQGQSLVTACTEWLSGLASACGIEYRNHKIIELLISWEVLTDKSTDTQIDKALNNWFNVMANKLAQLMDGYHIPDSLDFSFDVTDEMGSYRTGGSESLSESAEENALWQYNSARAHDGLEPLSLEDALELMSIEYK